MAAQYVTDEQGQRVGVVLDWATYQKLMGSEELQDPELLPGLGAEELLVLSDASLSAELQQELGGLLAKNREEQLSKSEAERLDGLLSRIDRLNILKARARYTLQQLHSSSAA